MKQNISEMYFNRNVKPRQSDENSQFADGPMAWGRTPIPEFPHEEDSGSYIDNETDNTSQDFEMRRNGGTEIYMTEVKESINTHVPNQTAPENENPMNQTMPYYRDL